MTRLSPQTAIVLAFQFAVLILLVARPVNLGMLTVLAALYWLAGGGRRHWWIMGLVLALGTWSVVLSQGLFYEGSPRTVLIRLLDGGLFPFGDPPGLYVYREGLLYGLVQSLRFNAIVLLGGGLLARYATDEMAVGLRALRIPGPLCFLFSITLRFFPLLMAEARAVWHAQHFRGYRLLRRPWPVLPARGMAPARVLLQPFIAAQVRKSDEIAAALRSRGFSPGESELGRPAPTGRGELAICVLGAVLLAALAASLLLTRLHGQGALPQPFSQPWPREWLEWLQELVVRHV